MHVVATAGHVDHGKSTLVRLLTGMEPDRWAEERRRGMTIDLGFAWTRAEETWLPHGEQIAFVDVPGHERFVKNMLAGVGPVPAVLFVVAADGGWMPQSEEHLAVLDALGVTHGLLVVTRADLAEPETVAAARAGALDRLAASSLGQVPSVVVSGRTGAGLDDLRRALADLVAGLPAPDPTADVRLWVDRAFTRAGAGTVVTGTLAAGRLRVGDELTLSSTGGTVRVRGLQVLGSAVQEVGPVARVAVSLRGPNLPDVVRGRALTAPGRWLTTTVLDVRTTGDGGHLPKRMTLHVGAAAVPAAVRPLGAGTVRLGIDEPLPLRVGDRLLLRDPGDHSVTGARVLDVRPPALRRRGAAAARADDLRDATGEPDLAAELRRRGVVAAGTLRAMGVDPSRAPVVHGWVVHPPLWTQLAERLADLVTSHDRSGDLSPGPTTEEARHLLGLPDRRLVDALAAHADGVALRDGRVVPATGADDPARLPAPLLDAVRAVAGTLASEPFRAPEAPDLARLGLGAPQLGAAVRAGLLLRVADGVYLLPGADRLAATRLASLPQPFTTSTARQALDTSRRVAVPLLELLDRTGYTVRVDDQRREVVRR